MRDGVSAAINTGDSVEQDLAREEISKPAGERERTQSEHVDLTSSQFISTPGRQRTATEFQEAAELNTKLTQSTQPTRKNNRKESENKRRVGTKAIHKRYSDKPTLNSTLLDRIVSWLADLVKTLVRFLLRQKLPSDAPIRPQTTTTRTEAPLNKKIGAKNKKKHRDEAQTIRFD